MVPFRLREPLPIYDHERGAFYYDALLAFVSLGLLILSVGLGSGSVDCFLSSFFGSLCGIAGLIFSIFGIIDGIKNSRSARTSVGFGALSLAAVCTFANMYIFIVDVLGKL